MAIDRTDPDYPSIPNSPNSIEASDYGTPVTEYSGPLPPPPRLLAHAVKQPALPLSDEIRDTPKQSLLNFILWGSLQRQQERKAKQAEREAARKEAAGKPDPEWLQALREIWVAVLLLTIHIDSASTLFPSWVGGVLLLRSILNYWWRDRIPITQETPRTFTPIAGWQSITLWLIIFGVALFAADYYWRLLGLAIYCLNQLWLIHHGQYIVQDIVQVPEPSVEEAHSTRVWAAVIIVALFVAVIIGFILRGTIWPAVIYSAVVLAVAIATYPKKKKDESPQTVDSDG